MSGEQRGRHEPDGKEDGTINSQNLTTSKNALEGDDKCINESEACTSEVTAINNQVSDDSLEDDAVSDNGVVTNEARDKNVDTGQNTKAVTEDQDKEGSTHNSEQGKITGEGIPLGSNGGNSVISSNDEGDNVKKDVPKTTASSGSLQANSIKSSQSSTSRFTNSSSRIPVLKGFKGKPSPLVEPHKASVTSVTTTTTGEFPLQEANSSAQLTSDNMDTPVSVALQEIPSSDSLHQHKKETSFSNNKHKETAITTQAYSRGWNAHRSIGRPSQLPGISLYNPLSY